jgi:hypothetical protein
MKRLLTAAALALLMTNAARADALGMARLTLQMDQRKLVELENAYNNMCYPNGPIRSSGMVQAKCRPIADEIAATKDKIIADGVEISRQQSEDLKQAQQQAKIDAEPVNVVFRGYQMYINVTLCSQVREGYLVKFINDVEMERSTKAIKAIVEAQKKRDPSLDTEYVWNKAKQEHDRSKPIINLDYCRNVHLRSLLNASPQPVFHVEKPDCGVC